jgi:hypothetical protein
MARNLASSKAAHGCRNLPRRRMPETFSSLLGLALFVVRQMPD